MCELLWKTLNVLQSILIFTMFTSFLIVNTCIYIGMPITFIQLTCCINHHCVSLSFFTELSFMFSIFCAITVPFLLICIVLFMVFFFAAITFFFHQYFIHIFHQNKTAVYLFPVFPFNNTIHFIVALINRCFS